MAVDAAMRMRPVVFGGMAGWFHPAAGDLRPRVGVILCAPLGRDARCAHRPMRIWADRLAAAGYPTLRYDHLGTGDSLNIPDGADATACWLAAIQTAKAYLMALSGVSGVVLGGVRMGATLAAVAAQDMAPSGVEGLMLLGPVTVGRAWLRELRLTAAVSAQVSPADIDTHGMEADGLHLTGPMVRSLSALDLRALSRAPSQVLLLHQNDSARAPAPALEALGARVEQDRFEGYRELFLDAHSNHPPEASFARSVRWLSDHFPAQARSGPQPVLAPPAPAVLTPPGARETAVTFGQGLWGVHCAPSSPEARGRAILFLNSGGDPRFGIGRFSVDAGRVLAAEGIGSLRFDFAGLGDSADPPNNAPRHVYESPRWDDMSAAVSFMLGQGYRELIVLGVCAGAHHALHAALTDARIRDAMLVSPVKMIWRPGDSLDFNLRGDGRSIQAYLDDLKKPDTWRRFFAGKIDMVTVARTLFNRLGDRLAIWRADARSQLYTQIDALAARGGRLVMLMGVDDAALDEVEAYFGPRGARVTAHPGNEVIVAPGLDHGLALSTSRLTAMKTLRQMLGLAAAPDPWRALQDSNLQPLA